MNTFKKIANVSLLSLCVVSGVSNAQMPNENMGNHQGTKWNIELDLVQPMFLGYGATVGIEQQHWGYGLMGFSTELPSSSRDITLQNAQEYTVHNWGVEVWSDYYLDASHQGWFGGALLSFDGYELRDENDNDEQILALYAAPRIGYRWAITAINESLYLQPALATPIKLWDNAETENVAEVEVSPVLVLPMLTLGFKF